MEWGRREIGLVSLDTLDLLNYIGFILCYMRLSSNYFYSVSERIV